MRIIQLVYSLSSGGAEKFVVNLSNELVEMGHEVCICMLLSNQNNQNIFYKESLDPRIKIHFFQFSHGFTLGKVRKVCDYIGGYRPDVVHCHLNVIPYIFPLVIKKSRIRFIHTLHSVAKAASGTKLQNPINKFLYRRHWIVPVTISKECSRTFQEFYAIKTDVLIENGCPQVYPSMEYSQIKSEFQSYKMNKDSKIFIHVARWSPVKNQKLLIDAFNQLDREGKDFVLIIVGRGFEDGEGRALRKSACSKIHFLGEKIHVGDYLLCSDAFCLTSLYEGLPISLIEAMSCGLTPICTKVGGIPDVLEDGITGYLAESGNETDYVNKLKKFMLIPLSSSQIKDVYERKYSMQTCVQKYIYLYTSND